MGSSVELKLVSLSVVVSNGVQMFGLDSSGVVWSARPGAFWERVHMSTVVCPACGQAANSPKQYVKADGHGRLNKYCEDAFHKDPQSK